MFRQYRQRGADETLAVWTVLATGVCAAVALGAVAALGLAISGAQGARLNLVGVTIVSLVVTVVVGLAFMYVVWRLKATREVLAWSVRVGQRAGKRFLRSPQGDSHQVADGIMARFTTVQPSRRDLGTAMAYALGNWILDCGCLAAAFLAVGASIPWKGLLLAYGAGQLAANLPITPGGLGVVEGSLTIALVAYGGLEASTVAAVLLYRVINFWASLPVGWLAWAGLALQNKRRGGSDPARARGGDGIVMPGAGRRTGRTRAGTLIGALLGLSVLTSACTGGHSSLGSTASPCFKALPLAEGAVHHHGRLLGVRRVTPAAFGASSRVRSILDQHKIGKSSVCVIAFQGPYKAGQVDHVVQHRSGNVAIVFVDEKGSTVLASFVLDRLPLRFRHLL